MTTPEPHIVVEYALGAEPCVQARFGRGSAVVTPPIPGSAPLERFQEAPCRCVPVVPVPNQVAPTSE